MITPGLIALADIQAARERIAPYVRRTPQIVCEHTGRRLGRQVSLKLELLQKTGSFKVRGAFNKVLKTAPAELGQGLVAVSGGNHAQAVAYVAQHLGLKATIIMPSTTPLNYVEGTRSYGASVVLAPNIAAAFATVHEYKAQGWLPVHPFDDPDVIAGQGTLGLEVLEDVPEVTDLVVSIGGGGFIGGIATAVKALRPEVRIWGVETVGADAMAQALAAGHPVEVPKITSIAKTLGAPAVSDRTLELTKRHVESVTVVTDAEAIEAMRFLLDRSKVLTEPAASCTLAAADRLRDTLGPNTVLVLCGGNIGVSDLLQYLSYSGE